MSLNEKGNRHPLIDTLVTVKGNPKIVLFTEPLWGIPFSLYAPFVSVYMAALLLSDSQIGLVASVFMLVRAITAVFAGAVTDKLGRKLATFIFDTLSWTIPCLLWAFSQNFWWFVVAAALNGLIQIPHISWMCLLVEDAKKESLVNIFTILHLIGQLAVVFAPLAAIMVNQLSIIPAMRILYIFSFVSMTLKFIFLYKFGDETEVGRTRMQETKNMSIWKIMSGYGEIYKKIFASHDMILALVLTTIFNITGMISGSFFGLYVTGTLLIPDYLLAYFPIVRSVVIVVFFYLFQSVLNRFGFRNPMLIGLFIFIAGNVLLVLTPEGSLPLLFVYTFIEAIAYCFVLPRSDSLTQLLIEPSERARISGLMMVIYLGLSIPFGYFAGWLSEIDRRNPFILIIGFLFLLFIVIAANKKRLAEISKEHR